MEKSITRIKVNCSFCGKELLVQRHKFKNNKNHFCNQECYHKWNVGSNNPIYKEKIIIKCDYCGLEKEKFPSLIRDQKNHFCSIKCRGKFLSENNKGESHHNFSQVKVKCIICEIEILRQKHLAENVDKKFVCSKECLSILQSKLRSKENNPNYKGGKFIPCEICGKEKWVLPSRQVKNEDRFCSKECFGEWAKRTNLSSLENNANWRGGISFEPYSFEFNTKLKDEIRRRDSYTCQICGKLETKRKSCVHHIDYNKKNNSEENLIALCTSCHGITNFNREHWKEYFEDIISSKYNFNYVMEKN